MDDASRKEYLAVQCAGMADWAKSTAARLRRLADTADRIAAEVEAASNFGEATERAATLVHEISWGTANMQLDRPGRAAGSVLRF